MEGVDPQIMADAMNKKKELNKSDIVEVKELIEKVLNEIQDLKKALKPRAKGKVKVKEDIKDEEV